MMAHTERNIHNSGFPAFELFLLDCTIKQLCLGHSSNEIKNKDCKVIFNLLNWNGDREGEKLIAQYRYPIFFFFFLSDALD